MLGEAIRHAPALGVEVFAVTIFGSNSTSIRLFERHGFERWGFMRRFRSFGRAAMDSTAEALLVFGLALVNTSAPWVHWSDPPWRVREHSD